MEQGKYQRIWLEVADAQFQSVDPPASSPASGADARCNVQLKADKEHPERLWWPVDGDVLGSGKTAFDVYKGILGEIDKKRTVLAGLTWNQADGQLYCDTLRFQSAELGSR